MPSHRPESVPSHILEQSYNIFRALMDETSCLIFVKDREGHYVVVNTATAAFFNRPADEVLGRTDFELVPADSAAILGGNDRDVISGGSQTYSETIRIGGRLRTFLTTKLPCRDRDGALLGLVGIAHEITDRAGDESGLDSRMRQQSVVADLGRLALQSADLETLLQRAVAGVTDALGVRYCQLLELLPDGDSLVLRAGAGWEPQFVGSAIIPTGTKSQAGFTLLTNGPVVVEDLGTETRFTPSRLFVDHGIVSSMTTLIRGRERPFGVLGAHSKEPRMFSAEDVLFLRAVANVVAEAVETERSRAERAAAVAREQVARRAAERAQRHIQFLAEASNVLSSSLDYETTLASVARLAVPYVGDWCVVQIVESDGRVRTVAMEHVDAARLQLARELDRKYPFDPEAHTGLGGVLRTGQSELVPEITEAMLHAAAPDDEWLGIVRGLGLTSSMTVPMVAREKIIGGVTFVSAESGRHFGQEDLALAEGLASRAALAVDNAQLYRESLRVAAEQEAILSQMADCVAMVDASGRLVYLNDAARRSGAHATGERLETILQEHHVRTSEGLAFQLDRLPLARALRGETVVDAVWRIGHDDHDERVYQGSAAPVRAHDGTLLGAVSTYRDITDQFSLERQKDEFLAAAAHDLKTPLTSIKGLAQLLRRRASRPDHWSGAQTLDALERIDTTATRMTRMINEMLDITRVRMDRPFALDRRQTNLVGLVQRVGEEFRHVSSVHRINVDSDSDEIVGYFDPARVERAIGNLVSNAIKYSPAGGTIRLTVSRTTENGRSWARVSVSDSGIGIPESDLPHIFDRFYRAGNSDVGIAGTGLGLAVVRQVVEEHRGTVDVQSSEGKGTTFSIQLPLESE